MDAASALSLIFLAVLGALFVFAMRRSKTTLPPVEDEPATIRERGFRNSYVGFIASMLNRPEEERRRRGRR